jgi:hypothetical protein
MTTSTIERAYELARSGRVPDLVSLKQRLKADGCRAVDQLLSPRAIRGHLEAICAAAFQSAAPSPSSPSQTDRRT